MLAPVFNALRRFRGSEEGSLSIEAVLMFPMLAWSLIGCYVFFDAYHSKTVNLKAAYSISDALSRETGFVTPSYMTNLDTLQERLTYSGEDTSIRVTVVGFDEPTQSYIVRWSQSTGAVQPLTTETLQNMVGRLPMVPDGEVVIVVQNWVHYQPVFESVMAAFDFENLVVTRPRFAPQLCWNSSDDGGNSTAVC